MPIQPICLSVSRIRDEPGSWKFHVTYIEIRSNHLLVIHSIIHIKDFQVEITLG